MASRSFTTLAAVDGIRGLACLIVLVVHALAHFQLVPGPALAGSGKIGVWLFFVLSAFLLSLRLLQRGFGLASLSDYMLGRCLRIIPPYAIACFVYCWTSIGIASSGELRDALLMQQGFIHLWTIPVEFKFYFVLPPLVVGCLYVQRRLGSGVMVAAVAIGIVVQQLLWPYWATPGNSPQTRWFLGTLLLGIPCALLLPVSRRLIRPGIATLIGIATFVILLLSLPGTRQWLSGTSVPADLANKHLFLGLLWVAFVAALADGQGVIGRLLRSRPLSYLGQISYSTYLFHYLFVVVFATKWPQSIAGAVLALVVSLLAGALGYYLIEMPFERLRRKVSLYQPGGHDTPTDAEAKSPGL